MIGRSPATSTSRWPLPQTTPLASSAGIEAIGMTRGTTHSSSGASWPSDSPSSSYLR
ncbi:hypothetical protein E2C01_088112 [Portunus trituberculatus]|uniref:Uncharacterized protein n=1 Tax=Portunus trituberculatus TaxID=210409 RepID=A0A5B7JIB6_PORTR|nr:hypothetical protein [Portunus trituberculatus]